MAIDGRIRRARKWGECVVITIGPRVYDNKHLTNPGQRRLTILNATYMPQSGQAIWGGSDTCHIEPLTVGEPTRHYRRQGSTKLIEVKKV